MVERIPKIESDALRIQRKEDADDDQQRGKRGQQGEQEDHDEFAPKLDFKKWTGKQASSSASHQSLWEKHHTKSAEGEPALEPEIVEASDETTVEESTQSTTITFLRASGIMGAHGRPQWGTIALYTFALIGFIFTVSFVINALL